MKKLIFTLLLLAGMLNAHSTNVSGGIYSNATWTLANSPYVVTDTVVVFSGVTLTIQPGVTVKFADHKRLEIRQGLLIAEGTPANPITFTSNSVSPTMGIWGNIFLNGSHAKIKYCNFYYADVAIWRLTRDSIRNCTFEHNNVGLAEPNFLVIDSCNFLHNNNGINDYQIHDYMSDSLIVLDSKFVNIIGGISSMAGFGIIKNCIIDSNLYGINAGSGLAGDLMIDNCHIGYNHIGINFLFNPAQFNWWDTIRNCIIEYNSTAGMYWVGGYIIYNCQINNNGTGLSMPQYNRIFKNQIKYNKIGIWLSGGMNNINHNIIEVNDTGIVEQTYYTDTITCNRICNNPAYEFINKTSMPCDIQYNYWCTTDSTLIENYIYDGYDNINYSLVTFMPIDTMQCYSNSPCSAYFNIYPDSIIPHQYWAVNYAFGVPPLSYNWDWGDGTFDYTPYPSHIYSNAGPYTICLTITDFMGCTNNYCYYSALAKNTNTMVYVNVISDILVGTNKYSADNSFNLYPNPATDILTLTATGLKDETVATVYDLRGQTLLQHNMRLDKEEINIGSLAPGVYVIKVCSGEGVAVRKFVKK